MKVVDLEVQINPKLNVHGPKKTLMLWMNKHSNQLKGKRNMEMQCVRSYPFILDVKGLSHD